MIAVIRGRQKQPSKSNNCIFLTLLQFHEIQVSFIDLRLPLVRHYLEGVCETNTFFHLIAILPIDKVIL